MKSARCVRTRVAVAGGGVLAVALSIASNASAQGPLGDGFDLERIAPTPAGDRFELVPEARVGEPGCTGVACQTAIAVRTVVAKDPLRLTQRHIDGTVEEISSSYVRTHLAASWAPTHWVEWSVDLPFNIYQSDLSQYPAGYAAAVGGERVGRRPDPGDVGDVRVGMRVGWTPKAVGVALQLLAAAPTGDREMLTGAPAGLNAEALGLFRFGAHDVSPVVVALSGGVAHRPVTTVASGTLGGWGLKGGLGASLELVPWLQPTAELGADDLFAGATWIGAEASFGLRFKLTRRIWLTATETNGLSHSPGIPRLAGMLGFSLIPWTDNERTSL